MDNHDGRDALPRAHRPRAPTMSSIAPLTAPLGPLRPPPPVSLVNPRPEKERITNEYVETPLRRQEPLPQPPPPAPPRSGHQRPRRLDLPPQPPITKQPPATISFQKERQECGVTSNSIICPDCGCCRCDSCQRPRPLPERWVCHKSCLLSADTVIDYASCVCCVKGLFYHCSETDSASATCADSPCSCYAPRRTARWCCLGALSCVLPCLWLYWPLRGCKRLVEVCYAQHSRSGCRCRPPPPVALATPEKRLLDGSNTDLL